ncbi:MAG: hypothetical protein ABSF82_09960 [Candidatus Bathyarchaeia archaeon]
MELGNSYVKFAKVFLFASLMILVFWSWSPSAVSSSPQGAKIELSFSNDRPLRGDLLIVNGRLSSTSDDRPIPLLSVSLQYNRVGDTNATREVSMITSNPSGLFQDIVNTTYLLRIGPWVVNASFSSQLGYQATSSTKTFTVVIQPSLSLYLSTNQASHGREVEFNGLLFACIPCLQDHVVVALIRPDNTSIMMHVALNATGGPYPGGYYEGRFSPDMPGQWHIRAIWEGNDVSLPAYSEVEVLNVDSITILGGVAPWQLYSAFAIVVLGAIAVIVVLRRGRVHERPA